MIKQKEIRYEWLRVISCFMVVMLHISAVYLKDDFRYLVSDKDYIVAVFFRMLTPLAVPTFVMLSGAFLINSQNSQFNVYYKKVIKRYVIPTLIYSMLYVIMHYGELFSAVYLLGTPMPEKDELLEPLINWLNGVPNVTLWYMYMIIGLNLLVPIFVWINRTISCKSFNIWAIIMLIYGIIVSNTCSLVWIAQPIQWIGYFLMGKVIFSYSNKIYEKLKNATRIGWGLIFISYIVLILYWYFNCYLTFEVVIPDSFSIIVTFGTIMQFLGFSLLIKYNSIPKGVSIISDYSMNIYLLHPLFVEIGMQLCGRIIKIFPSAIFIPVITFSVVILCYLCCSCAHSIIRH